MESSTFAYVDEIFTDLPEITPREITEDIRTSLASVSKTSEIDRTIAEITRCKEMLQKNIQEQSHLLLGCDNQEATNLKTKLKGVVFEVRDIFNHVRKQMLIVKDLEDQYHYEIRVVEKNISKFADFIDFLKRVLTKQ